MRTPYTEGQPMDKIIVKGLKIFAYHGVNEERSKRPEFYSGYRLLLSLAVPV